MCCLQPGGSMGGMPRLRVCQLLHRRRRLLLLLLGCWRGVALAGAVAGPQ
jgi:hypothetical protein